MRMRILSSICSVVRHPVTSRYASQLTNPTDFYNLDYLMDEEIPVRSKATYMRSSMNHNSKLDLSSIEDPLIAQAMTSGIRPPNAISTPIVSLPGKRSDSPRRQRSRANSRTTRPTTPPPFTNPYDYDFGDDDLIDNDLVTHARVYAVADKYGIPGLKALAQKKFETQTAARWDDYDFLDAMEEVYTTTAESDRGLRNVVVQAFRAHPHLARRPETREVIDEIIPLAQDLGRWRLTSFAPQWVR